VPEDGPAIARVQVMSWRETYAGMVPQDYLDALDAAERGPKWTERIAVPAAVALVAEDEAGVFGFAAGGPVLHPVDGFDGELVGLYVLAQHHRRGVGRALMREFAARMVSEGYRSLVIWALRENPACGFYQRMGGMRVAEQTIEISGKTLPEVAFGWADILVLCAEVADR
jgi:ribosomal protein S18 acetylase RimI-like enzyme